VTAETCCTSFSSCSAPLCPRLDAEALARLVWYPDDDVCTGHGLKPSWVAVQRRIARRARDRGTCYTARMLAATGKVTPGISGLSPDLPDFAASEARWCARRSVRDYTEAERAALLAIGFPTRKGADNAGENPSGAPCGSEVKADVASAPGQCYTGSEGGS